MTVRLVCDAAILDSLGGPVADEAVEGRLQDNGVVLDPEEGLNLDGTIRTGVRRDRVPTKFEPVLVAAVEAFGELPDERAELHLYGSVATGMAQVGLSDVDLLAIGVPEGWACDIGAVLSGRFADLCRGVQIGLANAEDFRGADDAEHGNRVFLHRYCVPLAGADAIRSVPAFPGDVRAARGFNGDIGTSLNGWRSIADPKRVARKTLLAAAGLISVHDGTWTTDRCTAARRWAELDPGRAVDIARLLSWADGRCIPSAAELGAALGQDGIVVAVVERFATDVGLWSDHAGA